MNSFLILIIGVSTCLVGYVQGQCITYTIRSGDTCTSIGIYQPYNPQINCNALYPGQTVCIYVTPQSSSTTLSCPSGTTVYTIVNGDTCNSLGLSTTSTSYNCQNLQIGQQVCKPNFSCPSGYYIYTATTYETCASLGLSSAANPTINCNYYITPGQRCCRANSVAVTCPSGYSVYTIVNGDTCVSLGIASNTQANPNINCQILQIGQQVCKPNTAAVTCYSGYYSYIIRSGDTCNTLGLEAIVNPFINCLNLVPGTQVCLRNNPSTSAPISTTTCPSGYAAYTVQSGDTCSGTGLTAPLNSIINCNNLQIGQLVCKTTIGTNTGIVVSCQSGYTPYTIQNGDTCTGSGLIAPLNSYINCNNLQIGQIACKATSNSGYTTSCPSGYSLYQIKYGDTCASLGIPNVATTNVNCNYLQVGQVVCVQAQTSLTCPSGYSPYTIKYGDTCNSLGISQVNYPYLNCNGLTVGTTFCKPATTVYSCPSGYSLYTIKNGESCYSLGLSSNSASNPSLNCNAVYVGQQVCLPVRSSSCVTNRFYTILNGDNCYSIAYRYGYSDYRYLIYFNPSLNCNNLQIGNCICV